MHPAIRGLLSVVLAVFVGFTLAFLLVPDPTSTKPMIAGVGLTVVLSPFVYRYLYGGEPRSSH